MYCPEQDFVNLYFKKKYPLANEFNAIWFNPGYWEMAPLMVHYLSFEKPWNKFIHLMPGGRSTSPPANGWKDI